MIAYTTLLLFFIGIFSSIKVGAKVDKTLSFLTFASIFFVFAGFCDGMSSLSNHSFSFVWSANPGSSLKFDIISNYYNYWLIFPGFVLTLLSMLNCLFFRYEKQVSAYFSVLIFNLIALIILVTSNNFVQLLSALFVIDVLSVFMIKESDAYRRYVLLNILSDMVLFAVLAVINCRVASLDIRQIVLYRNIGMHQDFVALAGLTAVFAKFGFFLFQIGVIDLKKIRFHRILNVLFLSSPLSALILLLKFNALWKTSVYFTVYLDLVCILSIIWGFLGSLCANNFKAKVIYWQMSFWALFVELLRFHGFIWFSGFTFLFLEMYVICLGLYALYYYNKRRVSMLQIKNMPLTNKKEVAYTLMIMIAVIAALSNTLTILYNNMNRYYVWTFAVLFALSLSAVINQLLRKRVSETEGNISEVPVKYMMFIEMILLSAFLLQDWRYAEPSVWGGAIVFALLCAYNPLAKMEFVYGMNDLQNRDVFGKIYHILIKSLRLCGRFFWLLIDRLFMEKFILALFISLINRSLYFFRRMHNSKIGGSFAAIVLLMVLLGYSYYLAGER